jgi:putative transposase
MGPRLTSGVCVIHLLSASFRYGSQDSRKKIAAGLRPIYTAPTVEAAEAALAEFEAGIGQKHPAVVHLWRNAWEVFVPFLAFPVEIRRVVYTT